MINYLYKFFQISNIINFIFKHDPMGTPSKNQKLKLVGQRKKLDRIYHKIIDMSCFKQRTELVFPEHITFFLYFETQIRASTQFFILFHFF